MHMHFMSPHPSHMLHTRWPI